MKKNLILLIPLIVCIVIMVIFGRGMLSKNSDIEKQIKEQSQINSELKESIASYEDAIKAFDVKDEVKVSKNKTACIKKFINYQTQISKITYDFEHPNNKVNKEYDELVKKINSVATFDEQEGDDIFCLPFSPQIHYQYASNDDIGDKSKYATDNNVLIIMLYDNRPAGYVYGQYDEGKNKLINLNYNLSQEMEGISEIWKD